MEPVHTVEWSYKELQIHWWVFTNPNCQAINEINDNGSKKLIKNRTTLQHREYSQYFIITINGV